VSTGFLITRSTLLYVCPSFSYDILLHTTYFESNEMSYTRKLHCARLSATWRSDFTKRQQFLLFIKILIKYIESKHPDLKAGVKKIVRECTNGNRNGILGYAPLMQAIGKRLQLLLGQARWAEANLCFQVFCARNNVPITNYSL